MIKDYFYKGVTMNKIILMGRLVKDPEIRYTTTQKVVATFTLAVDRPFTSQDGKKEVDFIPIVVWGKHAELIGNSCAKGHRLLVEGRLQIRSYDSKDGQKRWITEVITNSFDFVEKRADSKPKTMESMGKEVPFDEEVPF